MEALHAQEIEYSFDHVVNRQQDEEHLNSSSRTSGGPASDSKIDVSLFGYDVSLVGLRRGGEDCCTISTLSRAIIRFCSFGLIGVTLLIVLLWQLLGPLEVGWVVASSILALLSSWLWGAHSILSSPSKKVGTGYRLHKLFFISINMFFCFLDLFLYFIGTVETHRKVFDMEYHNLRNSIQQCISMSWNSGPQVNEWTCGTDPYGWYFLRSSNINVHNFAPWFLGPLLATSVIFTVHYLKEHKLFTWLRFHFLAFCYGNIFVFCLWASHSYTATQCWYCHNGRYHNDNKQGPWFLIVLVPWSVIVVIHYLVRNVNMEDGVSFTFFGITVSAAKGRKSL